MQCRGIPWLVISKLRCWSWQARKNCVVSNSLWELSGSIDVSSWILSRWVMEFWNNICHSEMTFRQWLRRNFGFFILTREWPARAFKTLFLELIELNIFAYVWRMSNFIYPNSNIFNIDTRYCTGISVKGWEYAGRGLKEAKRYISWKNR